MWFLLSAFWMNTSLMNWKLVRVEIQTPTVWELEAQQEAAVIYNLNKK